MVSDFDFGSADHLPKNRQGRGAANPFDLPRHRRGMTPQMHGRYPDYDVLEQASHWDEVTRELVESRVVEPLSFSFFTEVEVNTLNPFCDTVMAQSEEPKIPVLTIVDQKLHAGKLDGYRYEDMPDDRETWRRIAAGLDQIALERNHDSFRDLATPDQVEVCERFARGELAGGVWDDLPPGRAWGVVMRGILDAFYSHPWAWNEIGYAGPAYPRGYMRLGPGQREPYEKEEARHSDPVTEVKRMDLP